MPYDLEIKVDNLAEITERVRTAPARIKITLNEGLREIGHTIVPAKGTGPLADATPVKTGKLKRSTHFRIEGGPKEQILYVRQPARSITGEFYGQFVREGTRAHIIRARNALFLHWEDAEGKEHSAKQVNHPGTKPNPYHIPVFNDLLPRIQEIVNELGATIMAHLAGK